MNLIQLFKQLQEGEALTMAEARFMSDHTTAELSSAADVANGVTKRHYYLFTFTIDPKKHKLCDDTYDKVQEYIIKQLKRKPLRICEAYLVREGGDEEAKHTHWHASVTSEKPISKDRFNYYNKIYGNIDISKSKLQTNDEALDYISKRYAPSKVV